MRGEKYVVALVENANIVVGTITELSVLGGRFLSEEQVANGEIWRLYPTRPIREFFTACQERMDGGAVSRAQASRFVRC